MQRFQPKPKWLKISLPTGDRYHNIRKIVQEKNLHTVCQEARCPNMAECWGGGTATFMLMGGVCTRGCKFCHIKTGRSPLALDPKEPDQIIAAVQQMGLDYVVLTSVNRDDLSDGGAGHLAEVIQKLRKECPQVLVEILIPDFEGNQEALIAVLEARPTVLAHNLETVARLQSKVRDPRANYEQSLEVLRYSKEKYPHVYTKSSLMLGVGENMEEVIATFWDLKKIGVDIVTLGQYLQPSPRHLPVDSYITPKRFEAYKSWGEKIGFAFVASGPLVRSSYRAGEYFVKKLVQENPLNF